MIAKMMHRSCILWRKKFKKIINKNGEHPFACTCKRMINKSHGESHSIIKTLHSFGKGKTLKVTKIARKLRCTQEPQYTPTCGTTLSVSYLPFFSPNLGGGGGGGDGLLCAL